MKFTHKSKEEIQNMYLIEEGIYNFEITKAEERLNKYNGKPEINLFIKIWDNNGNEKFIFDSICEEKIQKLQQFCESVGLEDQYKLDELTDDLCIGKSGILKLKKRDAWTNKENQTMKAKNYVDEYLVNTEHNGSIVSKKLTVNTADIIDDEVPF